MSGRAICGFEFADHLMDGLELDSNGGYATDRARPGSGPYSYRTAPGQYARLSMDPLVFGRQLFTAAVWLDALPASGELDLVHLHGHGRPGYTPGWWFTFHSGADYPYDDPALYTHLVSCHVSADARLVTYNPTADGAPGWYYRSAAGAVPTGQWFLLACYADMGSPPDRNVDPGFRFEIGPELGAGSYEFNTSDAHPGRFPSASTLYASAGSLAGHGGTIGANFDDLNYLTTELGLPEHQPDLGYFGAVGCPHVHLLRPIADEQVGDWTPAPLHAQLTPGGYISSTGGEADDPGARVTLQTPAQSSAATDAQVITGVVPVFAHSRAAGTPDDAVTWQLTFGGFVAPFAYDRSYDAAGDLAAGWPAGFVRKLGQPLFASADGDTSGRTQIAYPRTHGSHVLVRREHAGTYALGATGVLIECWPALVPIVDPFPQYVTDAGDIAARHQVAVPAASFVSAAPRTLIPLDPLLYAANSPVWLRGQGWLEALPGGQWRLWGQVYMPSLGRLQLVIDFTADPAKGPAPGALAVALADLPDAALTVPLESPSSAFSALYPSGAWIVPSSAPLFPPYPTSSQHLRLDGITWTANPTPPVTSGGGIPGDIDTAVDDGLRGGIVLS